jgi:aryl-alcohol dehydrogenase
LAGQRAPPTPSITAAVLRQPGGPLVLERLELEGPRAGEVLVRLVASGICRTDVDIVAAGLPWPVVLGHEGAGIVLRVGRGVRGIRAGDHVVLSYQSCGRCGACRRDHPAACRHFWDLNFGFARRDGSNALGGGVRGHFFGQSSFATHALATRRNLVPVDRALPLELLAPLGCGLQTGAATVLIRLAVAAGEGLLILGAGTVGLAAVMAARLVGAERIVAVDRHPGRLELARELGATHTLDSREPDLARHLPAGLDHVIDTTGDAALCALAAGALAPGGRLALVAGGPAAAPPGVEVVRVIQGDAVPQRFIPRLIELWRAGRFPFDRLVTFYDLADIDRAIADMDRGETIKPVLRIGRAGRGPDAAADVRGVLGRRRALHSRRQRRARMAMDDEPRPQPRPGQPRNLAGMSVEELEHYVRSLEAEIARAKEAIAERQKVRAAAEALFRQKG